MAEPLGQQIVMLREQSMEKDMAMQRMRHEFDEHRKAWEAERASLQQDKQEAVRLREIALTESKYVASLREPGIDLILGLLVRRIRIRSLQLGGLLQRQSS